MQYFVSFIFRCVLIKIMSLTYMHYIFESESRNWHESLSKEDEFPVQQQSLSTGSNCLIYVDIVD